MASSSALVLLITVATVLTVATVIWIVVFIRWRINWRKREY
jgi:hypothetical protein